MKKPNIFSSSTRAAILYVQNRIKSVGDEVLVTISASGLVWARDLLLIDEGRKTKLITSDAFIGIYDHNATAEGIKADIGEWFISRGEQ